MNKAIEERERLRGLMSDDDENQRLFRKFIEMVRREFACGCEVCARTAVICPATASAMVLEIVDLRRDRDALRAKVERLRSAISGPIQHVCYDVKQYGCLGDQLQKAIDNALAGTPELAASCEADLKFREALEYALTELHHILRLLADDQNFSLITARSRIRLLMRRLEKGQIKTKDKQHDNV